MTAARKAAQQQRLARFRTAHPEVPVLLKQPRPTAFVGFAKVTGATLQDLLDNLDKAVAPPDG